MRIAILTYLDDEAQPNNYDPVVGQVADALRAGGHDPYVLAVHGDIQQLIRGLSDPKPDLVFNLMEMFGDNLLSEVAVAGLLELLDVPYTGCGPGEFYLQQDKALGKKLLAFDNILYPDYAVFAADSSLETGGNLRMPLFVKPLRADASIGIDGKSLVRNATDLMKRVVFIHEELNDSALAEEYIEGREFYVGVLGNSEPIAFPPIEMDFSKLPSDLPRILDSKAKWEVGSDEYQGTESKLASIPPELEARIKKAAIDAYRALRVRDYGRIDFRVAETGEIYVIEVNASCYLEKDSEFARSALAAGMDYNSVIARIVELALERYKSRLTRAKLASAK